MKQVNKDKTALEIIGSTEVVEVAGIKNIPAKIDTGADSSSIWASNIHINEGGILEFSLFDKSSPFYTGKIIKRSDYKVVFVRSSTGEEQIRYRTHLSLKIKGRKIKVLFNLSDRSRNQSPILIGKRTLRTKFVVDVSRASVKLSPKTSRARKLNIELKKDPVKFHQKYQKGVN